MKGDSEVEGWGCALLIALFALTMLIDTLKLFFNYLFSFHPAIPVAFFSAIAFLALFALDKYRSKKRKAQEEADLKAEQEAMTKIMRDENNDWRDPHW